MVIYPFTSILPEWHGRMREMPQSSNTGLNILCYLIPQGELWAAWHLSDLFRLLWCRDEQTVAFVGAICHWIWAVIVVFWRSWYSLNFNYSSKLICHDVINPGNRLFKETLHVCLKSKDGNFWNYFFFKNVIIVAKCILDIESISRALQSKGEGEISNANLLTLNISLEIIQCL